MRLHTRRYATAHQVNDQPDGTAPLTVGPIVDATNFSAKGIFQASQPYWANCINPAVAVVILVSCPTPCHRANPTSTTTRNSTNEKTKHFQARLSQRSIPHELIEPVLKFGELDQDRIVLNKRAIDQAIEHLKDLQKQLERAAAKGGLVIVSEADALITAYQYAGRRRTG